jgi:hypothetical protein
MLYYENATCNEMLDYPFFIEKLKSVEKLTLLSNNEIELTSPAKKIYKLAFIVWTDKLISNIKKCRGYPSQYFISIILSLTIIDDYIINPPIIINPRDIDKYKLIPLHYNKLLIIDALFYQGSAPRYLMENGEKIKYLYSEHSGVLILKNGVISDIIVSAESDRIDKNDDSIYLPINSNQFMENEYMFHTHPNTLSYAGRVNNGIIYEFPSANDLYNFVKYYTNGKVLASIISAPEGTYVIRPVSNTKEITLPKEKFTQISRFLSNLESIAIKKFNHIINDISDPNFFHTHISSDITFIKKYNNYINNFNLFIEYYPRILKNGEWRLRQIFLPFY